jgi:glycosyltransferase involved in cell wall biosynthesis
VSVVVTLYNYAHTIADAIRSVALSDLDEVEIVLVDDASTDDSLEVAVRYGDAVRIVAQPNLGIERACNRGVDEARGEYVVILSADDALEPAYVETLLEALRESPDASYAYCRARMFGARSGVTRCFPYGPYLLARRLNYINASALTRRADYVDAGGYAEELAGNTLEDWDLWLRLLERGVRGTYVRAPLLRWRRHAAGSRNVGDVGPAVEVIRSRHRPLLDVTSDLRGRVGYAIDLGVAVAELVLGLSRSRRLVRMLECSAWRRFTRWHAPGLAYRREPGARARAP